MSAITPASAPLASSAPTAVPASSSPTPPLGVPTTPPPVVGTPPTQSTPPTQGPVSPPPTGVTRPPHRPGHPGGFGGHVDEARTQAILAQMGIRKPDTVSTVLTNAAVFGGIGAALGLGASLLPFIGPVAAVIGGGIGAAIGLTKGLINASDDTDRYNAARAWVQYTYGGNRAPQPLQQQQGNTVNLPPGWTFADLDRLDELFPDDDPRPVAPQPTPATPAPTTPAPATSSTSTTSTSGSSLVPPPLTGTVTPGAPPALTGL